MYSICILCFLKYLWFLPGQNARLHKENLSFLARDKMQFFPANFYIYNIKNADFRVILLPGRLLNLRGVLWKWYFVTKIVLTYCERKIVLVIKKKNFEIRGWRPRICKNFEITRTICLNSERSEQFWVTECFSNMFLEASQVW